MRRALTGLFATLMTLLLTGEAMAETRVALVIGNSDYRLIPRLANPTNDAALMSKTLEEVGFEVIAETNADRRTMARAIKTFGKTLRSAGPETVGLFFYAGHGVQAGGANYLLPLKATVEDEADLEIEAVSAQWVLSQMESAGNALNMVILDACRNNPYRGTFRSATRGLVRMDAPSGSLVAYSAGPGKVAHDGIGRNSPYTAALAAAMTEPGLDIEDVFKTVRRSVEAETNGGQTPWEESSLKGDFYFLPKASKVTVIPPKAPPAFDARAVELAFWNSIEGSGSAAMFEEYKRRYPEGTFVGLADLMIKELLKAETQTAALAPPTFEVEEVDLAYVAVKRANVRRGPSTDFEKVAVLRIGEEVNVTGMVTNKNWLRIVRAEGGEGFVYAPLLSEATAVTANQNIATANEESELTEAVETYGNSASGLVGCEYHNDRLSMTMKVVMSAKECAQRRGQRLY